MSKIVSPVYMKRCTKCKRELPESDFAKNRSKPDGLNSECKNCSKKKLTKYYKNNKDSIRKVQKVYLEEHKLDIQLYQGAYQKKYIEENKGRREKYLQEYYKINKETIAAKRKKAKAKIKMEKSSVNEMTDKDLKKVFSLLSDLKQETLGSTAEEWVAHINDLEQVTQECIKRGLN